MLAWIMNLDFAAGAIEEEAPTAINATGDVVYIDRATRGVYIDRAICSVSIGRAIRIIRA